MANVQVVFCISATPEIGVGHFMRSLALAQSFDELGAECFFTGEVSGFTWIQDVIKQNAFFRQIESPKALSLSKKTVVIIDSYADSAEENLNAFTTINLSCSVVDNITPVFNTDLNLHLGPISGGKSTYTKFPNLVFGVDLIPIRREIKQYSQNSLSSELNSDPYLMFTLGGNSQHVQIALKDAFASLGDEYNNMYSNLVQMKSSNYPLRLASCQAVISGGGYSMWEAIYLRKKLALVSIAENQKDNIEFVKAKKIGTIIGQLVVGSNDIDIEIDKYQLKSFLDKNEVSESYLDMHTEIGSFGGNTAARMILEHLR